MTIQMLGKWAGQRQMREVFSLWRQGYSADEAEKMLAMSNSSLSEAD